MSSLFQDRSENWALCLVGLTGLLLFAALILEHAFAMNPCPLCLMQRIWFFIAGAFAYGSLLHNPRWGIYPVCTMAAAAIGGGFSTYQLYLQNLPADQVPSCGPDMAYMLESWPLSDVLIAMTRGTGDCAEVAGSLLGVNIPGWALASFAVVVVVAALQLRAGTR